MHFSEALEQGNIKEFGQPDKVIDTVLSKVFFFGDRVLKVYKHEGSFNSKRGDFAFRKEFYAEDFFWNHEGAPEIYLKLGGVKEQDGSFIFVDPEEADDFFIEMAKFDDAKSLTKLLQQQAVSITQIEELTKALVEKLRLLTKERREKLKSLFGIGWFALHSDALEDLRDWAYMAEQYMAKEKIDSIIDTLAEAAKAEKYFINFDTSFLSASIDTNSDNLLILDQGPAFIDIMPPKEEWKLSDEYFNIVRVATDAAVLGNNELHNSVYQIYEQYRPLPVPQITLIYEIRSALIQWSYRHMIGQSELAERYEHFISEKIKSLKNI